MKRYQRGRLRAVLACTWMVMAANTHALDSAAITASALSPECTQYRVTGICYWLLCTLGGCKVRTSVKVSHYIPDAVVSSYQNTGENPWTEVALMGTPVPGAQSGGGAGGGTTAVAHENNLAGFKNVDVIGHPGVLAFNAFASSFGYSCEGAGVPFTPYFLSTLDIPGWRYNLPESVYPEALVPGLREIGSRVAANLWGNVYPRGGFTHQVDDHKAAAITAQRGGDIVTRYGQPHVYLPLLVHSKAGYWPADALLESDASSGKWQELTPALSQSCKVFPDTHFTHTQARDGAYAWALWRPYSCCKRRGQIFLGSTDF